MEAAAPVTVEQAAAALGVSPSTVHRRIRSGALRAEQAERPQGRVWLVQLPPGVAVAAEDLPPPTSPAAAAPTAVPAQAEAMVSLIQTTIGAVLGPLVGQLDAQRQTIERQADRIEELAREVGELRAENRALLASTAPQSVEPTTEPADRPLRLWQPWWAILMAVAVGLVLTVALLAWPR